MKKIDYAQTFLERTLNLFRCPSCQAEVVTVANHTLTCVNGHTFDLSKKGTLYLFMKPAGTEYDGDMLAARRRMLQRGLFDGIVQAMVQAIPETAKTLLDVGCGEGTPLAKLVNLSPQLSSAIGFDISKPGIALASDYQERLFFCVADLANEPFATGQFDVVTDLFSPSAYQEFERVLTQSGTLIKVIPNANYLGELRRLLFGSDDPHHDYSNQRVLDLFLSHYPDADVRQVAYTFPLQPGWFDDLLTMTPLHWGTNADPTGAKSRGLSQITVDVTVLVARPNA
ncbi:methyltransferase domain-containing protein [Levilactobacillus bambusae]|uniref:23S rRNA methyltransferase n=1 Tax=Levilactobacillus bambusae TaxID=2024736 RepID=A0A2V1N070_9LACO|nr:methyltransferase domain-containing protein [Levilactobacillus bambusae]PWG00627.1 23S rRNA methyltransferase [Levilactobacillus bambusae]